MSFTLLGGKLTLKTPRNYPRPPEDALWLAASFTPAAGSHVLDAACGIGTVGLALLTRCPGLQMTGVEINHTVATTARLNATQNNFKVTISSDDILNHSPNHKYDAIFCNPPFHEEARGHTAQSATQTERHHMPANLLQGWLTHFATLISPTGTIALILHTHQQTELTALAKILNLGGTLHPLQTAPDKKPKRLLALLTPSSNNISLCDIVPIYTAPLRKSILEYGTALTLPGQHQS